MKTRVEELTVRLLDGLITEVEFEELERLVADPGAAETQAGLCELEALLRGLKRPDVSEGVLDRIRRERAGRIEGRVMERIRRLPGPAGTRASRTRLRWAIAAGFFVTVTLAAYWTTRPEPRPASTGPSVVREKAPVPPPEPPVVPPRPALPVLKATPVPEPSAPAPTPAPSRVPSPRPEVPAPDRAPEPAPPRPTQTVAEATIERIEGEVALLEGAMKAPALPGMMLTAGRTLVTSAKGSRASVVWPDKTKVELDPDTRLSRLNDAAGSKILTVEKGLISVATGAPMTVRTPQSEARILGTRFTVAVAATATRLTVHEGKVRLTRLADRASVDVPAGFFAFAGPGPKPSAHALDPLPPPPAGRGWSLTFSEEFDDAKVDRARWVVAQEVRKVGVWHPRNVQVEDGRMSITTSRVGDRPVSGGLSTVGKFEQAFGYFSARLKFPTQPGHRPSFGLGCRLGTTGGREGTMIQIVDKPEQTDLYHHHLSWGGSGVVWARWDVTGMGVHEGWHTFGLWWTPDEYVFYVDGRETWRTRHGGVSQVPEHLFFSDEVDEAAGDIRRATLPDQFLVDHVRAYILVAAESGR